MRAIGTVLILVATAFCVWFLLSYGREVTRLVQGRGAFELGMLDEVSVWFYRERGADGQPSGPYRLSRHLSIVDPLDGPNWEIRVAGWIPAAGSLGLLGVAALAVFGKKGRDAPN
jgi:hypothetical protein